jgi:hypothetical protein
MPFFRGQLVETLDLRGLGDDLDKLSTKLSTENGDGARIDDKSMTCVILHEPT